MIGETFEDICPRCGKSVDFLDEFYDYNFEEKVEVFYCDDCSLSIKVSSNGYEVLDEIENLA